MRSEIAIPTINDLTLTITESKLMHIWQHLLGDWACDATANPSFFALGGSSLSAAGMLALVKAEFGSAPTLSEFLKCPTVSALAQLLDAIQPTTSETDQLADNSTHLLPTPGQMRCYIAEQLMPGSALYNVCTNIRLTGALTRDALQRAYKAVAHRHETLRYVFVPADVHGPVRLKVLEDLPAIAQVTVETDLDMLEEAQKLARTPFQLAEGPLIRAALISTSAANHVLSLTMSHAIVDGWSLDLLITELFTAYHAIVEGGSPAFENLPITYTQYAQQLNNQSAEREHLSQLQYWDKHLQGATGSEIAGDWPRPAARKYCGDVHVSVIGSELYFELCQLARSHKATTYSVMAALFGVLCARFADEYPADVVFGTATFGRADTDLHPLIGIFNNSVVMRLDLRNNPTFADLLRHAGERTVEALQNQDVPFERVVSTINPPGSLNRNPLFNLMLIFDNPTSSIPGTSTLTAEKLPITTGTSRLDITLRLTPDNGTLQCEWEYDTELYSAATIQMLDSAFKMLAASAVEDTCSDIRTLNLLTREQRSLMFEQWNDTAVPISDNASVITAFDSICSQFPSHAAAIFADSQLNYSELQTLSVNAASGIYPFINHNAELKAVGVYVERSLEMLVSTLSVMRAGAGYVPLDPDYPADRLKQIVGDGAFTCIVTSKELAAKAAEIAPNCKLLFIDELKQCLPVALPEVAQEACAYVLYTSGSTGRPKGVAIPHRALFNFLQSVSKAPGLKAGEKSLATTTLSFDMSCLELYLPLFTGGTVVIATRDAAMDGAAMAALIQKHNIRLVQATPAGWRILLASGWEGGSNIKAVSSGEPLPPDLAARLLNCVGDIWNMYGPTETGYTTIFRVESADLPILIGKPMDNTRLYILDEARMPVPPGRVGELWIGGDGMAIGYVNLPNQTSDRFVNVPSVGGQRLYRSGDLARWVGDGNVLCLGRADGQVKLRGYRIETGDVEAAIAGHPFIKHAAVVLAGEGLEAYLAAFLVLEDNADFGTQGIRRSLSEHLLIQLPVYMIPARYISLPRLPLTPNSKVDRKMLRELATAGSVSAEGSGKVNTAAPSTSSTPAISGISDTKHRLLQIMQRVLGDWATDATENDSFFAMGGSSLSAVLLLASVKAEFGIAPSLRDFLKCPTMAALARLMDKLEPASLQVSQQPDTNQQILPAPGQLRFYLMDMLQSGSAFLNTLLNIRLTGILKIDELQQAYQIIAERHEALRCYFARSEEDGAVILKALHTLPPIEVRTVNSEEEMLAAAQAEGCKPFSPEQGPLVRSVLLRRSKTESLLSITIHHAVTDGWSLDLMLRELLSAYYELANGNAPSLEPLPISYFEYAVQEHKNESSTEYKEQLAYWVNKLQGCTASEITGDRPRPEHRVFSGTTFRSVLPAPVYNALCALARQEDTTLFSVSASLYSLLIARLSNQYPAETVFGVVTSGRTRAEYQCMVGMFVNSVVLRMPIGSAYSFRGLVGEARKLTLEALQNQDVPFESVLHALNPPRSQNRTPLFDLSLVFDNPATPLPCSAVLKAEELVLTNGTSMFDINLRLTPDNGTLRCEWEYDTALYDESTIQTLDSAFHMLAISATEDPDSNLRNLNLLTKDQRALMFERWNATAVPLAESGTVITAFDGICSQYPSFPAAIFADSQLTYTELQTLSINAASGIYPFIEQKAELKCVGVFVERSLDMLVSTLGIMRAGAGYVPLDPGYPADRLKQIVGNGTIACIVTSKELAARAAEIAPNCKLLFIEELKECQPVTLPPVAQQCCAYVLYTSGSTGQPKGVATPHRALYNLLQSVSKAPGLSAGEKILAATTLSFDISCLELYLPLITGGTVVIASTTDAMHGDAIAALIQKHNICLVQATPAGWRVLLASGWQGGSNIKAISGGEPLPIDLVAELLTCVGGLWNMYGPTETTIYSTIHKVENASGPILIGKPMDNTQLYILDEARMPLPPGRIGELCIGGNGLAIGYVNLPEQTADRFVNAPAVGGHRVYRSGDLARWVGDGYIQCLGRADGQVKLRGFRIETGDVEAALVNHPFIMQSAVVLAGEGVDAYLAAFVVLEPAAGFGKAGMYRILREHVMAMLPAYMVPAEFIELPELPLTPNAKTDRKALRAMAAAATAVKEEPLTEAADPLEMQVGEIWARYLRKSVKPEEDFFELGGHSLMAVKLLAAIETETGIRLRLDVLFKAPTVRSMCAVMRTTRVDVPTRCLVPIKPEGKLPPMFFVHGMGGGLLDARALAACLNKDRPFYGLQSAGMDPDVAPVETVEQMAKEYLAEVLATAPFGPVVLIGQCTLGGIIAYEMARQMTAMGRPQPALIMIDTEYRTGKHWSPDDDIAGSRIYQLIKVAEYHWSRIARLQGTASKLKYGITIVADAVQSRVNHNVVSSLPHLQKLHRANHEAVLKYDCPEYAGLVHHIVSTGSSTVGYLHRRLSWSEATTVNCRFIRGEHADLLASERAKDIADMIETMVSRPETQATNARLNSR